MALQAISTQPMAAALGQFVTKKVAFTSDQMLAGKVLKLNVAIYNDGSTPPTSPQFQILYPASAGIYEFTKLNSKNYKAKLKVIDSQNFEIHYSFFATKSFGWDDCINSQALSLNGVQVFDLGFNLKIDSAELTHTVPITISNSCTNVEFIESGFTPNVDLPVQIKISGSVNNNFYAAIIRSDAINNAQDIYPGLFHSYAKIGSGVQPVEMFSSDYMKDGIGFNEQSGVSTGSITLDGTKLLPGATYKILVIYYQDGEWKSCLSAGINQVATNAPIEVTGTYMISDENGNTATNCVSGVSVYSTLNLQFDVDVPAFDEQLESGTFSDFYKGAKAFVAKNPAAIGGIGIPFTDNGDGSFTISDFKNTEPETIFVIIQLELEFATHTDFVNVPFQINYNASEIDVNATVLNENGVVVDEICEGDIYTLAQNFDECQLLQTNDGLSYFEVDQVDFDDIPVNTIACFKAICIGEGTGGDCDCPPCNQITLTEVITQNADGSVSVHISTVVEGTAEGVVTYYHPGYIEAQDYTDSDTSIGSSFATNPLPLSEEDVYRVEYSIEVQYQGCKYVHEGSIESNNGPTTPSQSTNIFNLNPLSPISDCDCEEDINTPIDECNNYASIQFDCDEETGTITLDIVKNFDSPTEEEAFLCSFDGTNFVPCPATIEGEKSVFVSYDAVFSDGCPPLHIEQTIECLEDKICQNSREIELEVTGNQLNINITDSFESDVLTDALKVSIDNGLTFEEFNPASTYSPIMLEGDEKIVVENTIIFEDGCPDIYLIKTMDVANQEDTEECLGYDGFELSVSFDEETSLFSITRTGNQNALLINELKWTLGGANPFDQNRSGVDYNMPVEGEGLFIGAWRIKLPNCDEKTINQVAWGKKCIQLCTPVEVEIPNLTIPPIEVLFPTAPIEVCLVECCAGFEPEFECIDKVLTVTNAPLGSQMTWTGPNGYSASGNGITLAGEGLYFVTIIDNSTSPPCTSTGQYFFDMPNAGEPIDDPIIVT